MERYFYARVRMGEEMAASLLTRSGQLLYGDGEVNIIATREKPELIFHRYATDAESAHALTSHMRALSREIAAAADDLDRFIDEYDWSYNNPVKE